MLSFYVSRLARPDDDKRFYSHGNVYETSYEILINYGQDPVKSYKIQRDLTNPNQF